MARYCEGMWGFAKTLRTMTKSPNFSQPHFFPPTHIYKPTNRHARSSSTLATSTFHDSCRRRRHRDIRHLPLRSIIRSIHAEQERLPCRLTSKPFSSHPAPSCASTYVHGWYCIANNSCTWNGIARGGWVWIRQLRRCGNQGKCRNTAG